jgi:hypothetical protein
MMILLMKDTQDRFVSTYLMDREIGTKVII